MLVGLLALLVAAAWSAVLAYSAALALIANAVLLEVNLLKVLRTFVRHQPEARPACGAGRSSAKQSPASAGQSIAAMEAPSLVRREPARLKRPNV